MSAKTVRSAARKGPDADQIYADLLEEIWRDVQPLIGAVSLFALLASACRSASEKYPWVSGIRISVEGIERQSIISALSGAQPREVRKGMGELVKNLLGLFESVAGSIIVKQVVPKVMRAERLLGGGESRRG